MLENKIQVLSIEKQIGTQIGLIKELETKREKLVKEVDSDIALAKEVLVFLQSKINNQENAKSNDLLDLAIKTETQRRPMTPPKITDDYLLKTLTIFKDGLNNPEIRRFIEKEYDAIISEQGIRASLQRFMDKGMVEIVDPTKKTDIKYRLINKI